MDNWTRILTSPGFGGGIAMSAIGTWVLVLAGLVAWIARAPRESDRR